MYFFPFAHGRPLSETLKHAAALLCDAEHLAQVVADGEEEQAAGLLRDQAAFWAGLIPVEMIPAEQTIYSRRTGVVGKLARELSRKLAAATPVTPRPTAAPESAPATAPAAIVAAVSAAGSQPVQLLPVSVAIARPNAAVAIMAAQGWDQSHPRMLGRSAASDEIDRLAWAALKGIVAAGARVTPAQLDELALWLWPLGFPQSFGVERAVGGTSWWWDDLFCQRKLVERFGRTTSEPERFQCAAALRQSSLTETVAEEQQAWLNQAPRWRLALEIVADFALDYAVGTTPHSLALAVLARPDRVVRLQGLGARPAQVAVEVMLTHGMAGGASSGLEPNPK